MGATTRRMTEADRDAAFRIYADAYGAGPGTLASLADLPLTDRWVAEESGRIVALLRELPIGHSFGGRFVRSAGIAAVGVGLADRSRGASRALMTRDGMMDRPDWWWPSRVFEGVGEDAFLYRFRVREDGRTTGYRSGLLTGAGAQDLASLELLFHGPSPYLNEMW